MNILSRFCLAFLMLFASDPPATHAQPAASDELLLRIDAGRLEAMLDQVSLLLKAKVDDTDTTNGDEISSDLQRSIKRYNVLLGIACDKEVLAGPPCGEIYAPRNSPSPPSSRQLRVVVEDVTARIYPFWRSVCAKLDSPVHPACQME